MQKICPKCGNKYKIKCGCNPKVHEQPKKTEPFYGTARWKKFRKWYLSNNPMCETCLTNNKFVPAQMVDHIIELKDGGNPLDQKNTQALCWSCHAKKTARVRSGRK